MRQAVGVECKSRRSTAVLEGRILPEDGRSVVCAAEHNSHHTGAAAVEGCSLQEAGRSVV